MDKNNAKNIGIEIWELNKSTKIINWMTSIDSHERYFDFCIPNNRGKVNILSTLKSLMSNGIEIAKMNKNRIMKYFNILKSISKPL